MPTAAPPTERRRERAALAGSVLEKPYPGLRPFEAHWWSILFGRERMIDEVIERLALNRLVPMAGPG